jgi:flagellin-like protein|tara:strand:+ start:11431 stop:11904 length:474 start_codon:yes stop_codon:yes gene_type:complete
MIKKLQNKRAVSPVIATVLLIGLVVVIALIVFLWFKGLTQEAIIKFDKNVELVCDEVQFEANYLNGVLSISNIGNVPIYGIKVKISDGGNHETKGLKDLSGWPTTGLNQGKTFSGDISDNVVSADSVTLTPVLVGSSDSGEKSYTCDEARYGNTINL